jgi:hypothetical protein
VSIKSGKGQREFVKSEKRDPRRLQEELVLRDDRDFASNLEDRISHEQATREFSSSNRK